MAIPMDGRSPWLERIGAVRANASTKSHAELDESTELDPGDPIDLGSRYRVLNERLPNLTAYGGCCGTDYRHIAAMGAAITRPGVVAG
jgi:homocysteine S-methyltransferase